MRSRGRVRARREPGQSGPEYVGMALLAGVLIAALVVVITPADVGAYAKKAWCMITMGQNCEAPVQELIEAKLPDCEITNTELKGEVEGTIFSVNLGTNGKAVVSQVKKANGDTAYQVTFAGGGKLGAHVMLGEKAMAGTAGEGINATLKAAFAAEGGITYEFASKEAATTFVMDTAKEAAKWAVASTAGPFAGAVKGGIDWITDSSYNPPDPKSYYIQAGTKGSAEASAAAGPEAKLGLDNSNMLGVKVEPGSGSGKDATKYTYYYKGSAALTGTLGLTVKGEGESMVAITFQNGQAVKATIDVAGTLKDGFTGTSKFDKIPLGGKPATPKVTGVTQATDKGKATLTLDLTVPENKDAVADVLQSTGLPILEGSGTAGYQDPITAVSNLADRFTQAGPRGGATFTTQQFAGVSAELGGSAFAGDILTFGLGAKISGTELTATDASYYDPAVGGMVAWRRCGG